jgi:hypothetical protein
MPFLWFSKSRVVITLNSIYFVMEIEYVCCEVETKINSEHVPKQYSPIGLFNVDEVCFL